ncbi:MAG: endonuclease/exonuclease/phosphatase family protein, partial [Chitinophagales bacterium]
MRLTKKSFLRILSLLLFLSLDTGSLVYAQNAEPLKTMTFNIRYDNTMDTLNPWTVRKQWVVQLLKKYDTDIVGLQEALHHQMEYIEGKLPQYDWVGVGRDDGKMVGEYVSILYKKEKFELLDHNHFWLSKTPEQAGSKSWRALPRMVTWAKLKDKKNGEVFFVFNTHFDHHSK